MLTWQAISFSLMIGVVMYAHKSLDSYPDVHILHTFLCKSSKLALMFQKKK